MLTGVVQGVNNSSSDPRTVDTACCAMEQQADGLTLEVDLATQTPAVVKQVAYLVRQLQSVASAGGHPSQAPANTCLQIQAMAAALTTPAPGESRHNDATLRCDGNTHVQAVGNTPDASQQRLNGGDPATGTWPAAAAMEEAAAAVEEAAAAEPAAATNMEEAAAPEAAAAAREEAAAAEAAAAATTEAAAPNEAAAPEVAVAATGEAAAPEAAAAATDEAAAPEAAAAATDEAAPPEAAATAAASEEAAAPEAAAAAREEAAVSEAATAATTEAAAPNEAAAPEVAVATTGEAAAPEAGPAAANEAATPEAASTVAGVGVATSQIVPDTDDEVRSVAEQTSSESQRASPSSLVQLTPVVSRASVSGIEVGTHVERIPGLHALQVHYASSWLSVLSYTYIHLRHTYRHHLHAGPGSPSYMCASTKVNGHLVYYVYYIIYLLLLILLLLLLLICCAMH